MAKVDSLKDSTGTIVYPKTVTTAVYDPDTQKTVKEIMAEAKIILGTTQPSSGWWFEEIV